MWTQNIIIFISFYVEKFKLTFLIQPTNHLWDIQFNNYKLHGKQSTIGFCEFFFCQFMKFPSLP